MSVTSLESLPAPLLCGCLVDMDPMEIETHFLRPDVDMLEWRLDLSCRKASVEAVEAALPGLTVSPRHPVLVTNRPVHEGGVFDGPEAVRVQLLEKAAEAGAEWVDLELDVPESMVHAFKEYGSQVLISHHDFHSTLDSQVLRDLVGRMASKGPNAIKLVTVARTPQDNLRVLELISFTRENFGLDLIAFCMGPVGRWSRPASLLLGSPWAYVQLPGQGAAAPGQFSAEAMRSVLRALQGGS